MSKNIVPCGGFELGGSLKINKNNELDLAYGGILFCISNDNYVRFCDVKYYDEILAKVNNGEFETEEEAGQAIYETMEPYAIPIEEIFKMYTNLYPVRFLNAIEDQVYTFDSDFDTDVYRFSLHTFYTNLYTSDSFNLRYTEFLIGIDGKLHRTTIGNFSPTSAQIIKP